VTRKGVEAGNSEASAYGLLSARSRYPTFYREWFADNARRTLEADDA